MVKIVHQSVDSDMMIYKNIKSNYDEVMNQVNYVGGVVTSILKYQDKAVLQGDGNLDWSPVFNYMQTQALTCFVPYGTFNIYSRITPRRIVGVGRQRSIINQKTLSEPVIETDGLVYFSDFKVQHDSVPNSETIPNGAGILITDTSDGSVMQRLEVNNVTSGICLTGTGHVYSTTFKDIRITNFNHSAMYIGGTGHTGNVLQNIYAVNWLNYDTGTKRTSSYGFYFKGMDDGIFQQINLEHGLYGKGIAVSGSNIIFDSVHFEGFESNQDYGSLFAIDGTNTKTLLRNITLVYSKFDSSKSSNYSVISLDNTAKVDILGFREENNTSVGSPTLRKFYGAGNVASGAYIKARMFHMLNNLFGTADYFPNTPTNPYVRQFNDEGLVFTPIASASAQKQQLFIDSADNKLKFKDSAGTVNLLY